MIALAAAWIIPLLAVGGYALDRVLVGTITRSFDAQLEFTLSGMINAADIDETGAVRFLRPMGDQRFSEPYSGLYWQVSASEQPVFPSRSLWDRVLGPAPSALCVTPCRYASRSFPGEPLRVVGRTLRLPGSPTRFYFQVAQSTRDLDAQTRELRTILFWSLGVLGVGLLALAALQSTYGLSPLGRVSRAIGAVRSGQAKRVPEDFPIEIAPLVSEINELLEYTEHQAEAARRHAGNLAHALKTPMSVLIGETQGRADPLAQVVASQVQVMRRHVDHQLARARAAGQRGNSSARTDVWQAVEAIVRTVSRIHIGRDVTIDLAGDRSKMFRGERQDLDEMVGNLIDNAAVHGGGRVFVTISGEPGCVDIIVEDDGAGIPAAARDKLFERGERLDTDKPGTGLGLAIARDVAELYGGSISLADSEDLGGLMVQLRLPAAV
ncbi:ATP-binding protein [Polymorphobacter fuscus]|uniref:histidine kinase n=1 Tax=Sandarakinorhabdus fusca TaxID=1439888 RepID=A0A7C9KVW6_9SPHN|nr:ATP-binding protein [Polymorphobacter fuscus]KAB7648664.1 HAMP domain-containing histidine kinase [Polymorphobacter fuscus]MQT16222.1 histidine kinase [Polymorphobacter fuscus]NJC07493.1 signal transduction histidine kinase [Polymorphobacter fuscus]